MTKTKRGFYLPAAHNAVQSCLFELSKPEPDLRLIEAFLKGCDRNLEHLTQPLRSNPQ